MEGGSPLRPGLLGGRGLLTASGTSSSPDPAIRASSLEEVGSDLMTTPRTDLSKSLGEEDDDDSGAESSGSSKLLQSSGAIGDGKDQLGSFRDEGKETYLNQERHTRRDPLPKKIVKWRMRDRMKTVSVALVYCLNTGVDPPDVLKPDPCARVQAWLDPQAQNAQKALDSIGKALQAQYERWQPRARYKLSLDPTVDEVKKLCVSLRRNAKEERVLFHYNGHGVPRPTNNGEIWVFNKNYTQYIPLSIYELQTWMGSPSIYLFDCSAAGMIVQWFLQFAEQREKEYQRMINTQAPNNVQLVKDFILLAACGPTELLPMNPDLPADIFTSCLTTPIKMALRWFCSSNTILSKPSINFDLVDKIPGRLADRRTPLGELNWIFTAITDTIAWNVLPRGTFQKLFRQDLLVASLFRNFLLAERIMRSFNCTPISYPKLPPTHQNPLWDAWDLAVDVCLSQLPAILNDPNIPYKNNPFFEEQLTAFEVWLQFGSEKRQPPEQLPIVLQVLLSQAHRLRALELLGKFLDLGAWAVNLALSVGIFPYVLKLLQSRDGELRPILVFIWTKILALDKSCQVDLVKENGHNYFISVLAAPEISSDQRTMTAFILSVIVHNSRPGQSACLSSQLLTTCLAQLGESDPRLRKWVVLCLGKLWESFEDAKSAAIKELAHEKLCVLLSDPFPEVRAAAVYSLGLLIGGAAGSDQRKHIELNLGLTFTVVPGDASVLVRRTLTEAMSRLVAGYEEQFKDAAKEMMASGDSNSGPSGTTDTGAPFHLMWAMMLLLSGDVDPETAKAATEVVRRIRDPLIPAPNLSRQSSWASLKKMNSRKTLWKRSSVSEPKITDSVSLRKTSSMDFGKLEEEALAAASTDNNNKVEPTNFYEWSCEEFFARPMIKPEKQDLTAPDYAERIWRFRRNEQVYNEARKIYNAFNVLDELRSPKKAHNKRFDEQVALLDNSPEGVTLVLHHPFESSVAIADGRDGISIWDYESCTKLNSFKNRSTENQYFSYMSRTTSMCFLNDFDSSLLMTGSDDGFVRVWDSYDDSSNISLRSAWKAVQDAPRGRGAGLILNWQQEHGLLMTTGMDATINIWDLEKELCVQTLPIVSDGFVTCMSSEPTSRLLAAGCSDGSVNLFDFRTRYGLLSNLKEHKKCIVNVHIPRSNPSVILSGCMGSEVKFWDTTSSASTRTIQAYAKGGMTSLTAHNYAPVFACGSQKQKIKVFNFQGDELSLIRYHDGFLGQRIGPVSCLAFHPYIMLLAAGSTDSLVAMYTRPPL